MPTTGPNKRMSASPVPPREVKRHGLMSSPKGARLPEKKAKLRQKGQQLILTSLTGLSSADPAFDQALRRARAYSEARIEELSHVHGAVGAGVSGLISQAAIMMAASRYLMEQAAKGYATEDGVKVDMRIIQQAGRMGEIARQQEMAAAQLAEQEGKLLLAAALQDQDLPTAPWLNAWKAKKAASQPEPMDREASRALAAASPTPARVPGKSLGQGSITADADALAEEPSGFHGRNGGQAEHAASGRSAGAGLNLKQAAGPAVVTESVGLESALEPSNSSEDRGSTLDAAEDRVSLASIANR